MKKLQIFTLCSAIILGCVLLVNAKDTINLKNLDKNSVINRWTSITEVLSWAHASANITWATATNEETTWTYSCDLNNDRETNIADVNRFNNYCNVTNSQNPSKCDINKDWEFNVADLNIFYYNCMNEIMWTKNTCDFDENWKNDISDITRFIDNCYLSQKGGKKCDKNNNWVFDITDVTNFINDCLMWMLWTNTNNWTNNNWWNQANTENNNWKMSCDLNKDREINIVDISRFNSHCSVTNWRDSELCDFNTDWEFNIADINSFNYKCLGETLRWFDECDYDMNWKINISDLTTLMDTCRNAILMSDDNLLPICDFYKDWKLTVADITEIYDVCQKKILGTNTWTNNTWTNNTWTNIIDETQQNWQNTCDFNNDNEINIADMNRFNTHCSVTNWRDSNKCDLNGDREFNIADINTFNYTCYNEIMWTNTTNWENYDETGRNFTGWNRNYTWRNYNITPKNWYTQEMNEAFNFAKQNKITSTQNIENAKMYTKLTRWELAKMLTNYAENVLGKAPNNSIKCSFTDINTKQDKNYLITESCKLWIMGQWMTKFKPNDTVTRGQFATAISRLLYGDKYNNNSKWKYYEKHIEALQSLWIISNTSSVDPNKPELRWYAMLMLSRIQNN